MQRVRVQKKQPLTVGELRTMFERMSLAGPSAGQVVDRQDADAWVGMRDLASDLGGLIRAPVVHDEDLEVRIGLSLNRLQAIGQVSFLVLGRQDCADQGR